MCIRDRSYSKGFGIESKSVSCALTKVKEPIRNNKNIFFNMILFINFRPKESDANFASCFPTVIFSRQFCRKYLSTKDFHVMNC